MTEIENVATQSLSAAGELPSVLQLQDDNTLPVVSESTGTRISISETSSVLSVPQLRDRNKLRLVNMRITIVQTS